MVLSLLVIFLLICGCVQAAQKKSTSTRVHVKEETDTQAKALKAIKKRPTLQQAAAQLLQNIKKDQVVSFVDLTNSAGDQSKLSTVIFQQIEPILIREGIQREVSFIERKELKLILDEWQLESFGDITDVGSKTLLGADYIITGKVRLDDDFVHCSLKLIHLADGKIAGVAEGYTQAHPSYHTWEYPSTQKETSKSEQISPEATGSDKKQGTTAQKQGVSLMMGEWDTWQEGKGRSEQKRDADGGRIWHYSLSKKDSEAGMNLWFDSISIRNKQIQIRLHSQQEDSIWIWLFSFVPGYSKENDDDSWVPAGRKVYLNSGINTVTFSRQNIAIPNWWMQERGRPEIEYYYRDIRYMDFLAESYDAPVINPITNTIRIESVDLQTE